VSDSTVASPVPVEIGRNGGASSPEHLSYEQAREVPCLTCGESPCCTHLGLTDFELGSLMQVDHALFLANFEGILIGLNQDHNVDVYLHQPCAFLHPETSLCTVHSTPRQPAICVQYNAHTCAYRKRMTVEVDPGRPLMDRQRMRWLAERITFDEHRMVVGYPDWDEMLQAFATMPLDRRPLHVPEPDPVVEEWRSIVLSEKPAQSTQRLVRRYTDPKVSAPCQGCGAWCCKLLVFNRATPLNASNLDFMRYSLGFPGVEVGVADENWAVIVHTTCRHLDGNLCSVYGTDERPLKCGYYDALTCSYRGHFGVPNPQDIMRVGDLDQFELVADSIVFDELGRIVAIPPLNILRQRLEDLERARAG
jgi:Fe-S-cluster containining protein